MPEGENPTRRYKWLRPRQASWGAFTTLTPTNFATLYLFNNSQGAHVIVGRRAVGNDAGFAPLIYGLIQGKQGTLVNNAITPMVAGEAVQAGQLWYADRAAAYTPNIAPGPTFTYLYGDPYPYFALQPGFSFFAQGQTAGNLINLSILWEAIFPDELDFMF